jgi:integrase
MARRGQVGTIAVSGKWYVVRFWKYPAGLDRIHASEKICPVDSNAAGYLPKGERRRRSTEIVEASGVNDQQQFNDANISTIFRQQAEQFLQDAAKRKRRPVKPKTLDNWRRAIDKWLNPNLGDLPLASVDNATLKTLVAKFSDANLSAQTQVTYANFVKTIVASARSSKGERLFPREWDNTFIDLPEIENQHQPAFTAEQVTAIVENATGQYQVLYALLAGTGLRAGEVFGLEIKHLSNDFRTITVDQSCWQGNIQTPKTKNSKRQIDISSSLAALLKAYVGDRTSGLFFPNSAGHPLAQNNVLRRSLHPILKELGIPKTGFHAFRRFRDTYLENYTPCPNGLRKFWLAWGGSSELNSMSDRMSDRYNKIRENLTFRLEAAEKAGVGFVVPVSVRPMRPRKIVRKETEIAA